MKASKPDGSSERAMMRPERRAMARCGGIPDWSVSIVPARMRISAWGWWVDEDMMDGMRYVNLMVIMFV